MKTLFRRVLLLWLIAACVLGGLLVWIVQNDDTSAVFRNDPDYRR
jgi:hypothetical protein